MRGTLGIEGGVRGRWLSRVVVLVGGMDLPVALSNALRPFDRLCDVPAGSELSLDGGVSFATVRRPALSWD